MSSLLARFAENAFWMARYVERVENLARILDVNETFARDAQGVQEWRPILQLHSDEEAFFEHYKTADAKSVVRFYIIDRRNPNSIVNAIHGARENARSLRHLISLETWTQLNTFWNWASGLRARDVPEIDILLTEVHTGANSTGAIGIGEPATIPTAAAIAGAVMDAIGAPVRSLPITPDRVLDALNPTA